MFCKNRGAFYLMACACNQILPFGLNFHVKYIIISFELFLCAEILNYYFFIYFLAT